MRLPQLSSLAAVSTGAAAAALAMAVLVSGQALAAAAPLGSAPRPPRSAVRPPPSAARLLGSAVRPVPAARPGKGTRPGLNPRRAPEPGQPRVARPRLARRRHPIRVGSVTIPPCRASRLAWCTRINVPLDYRDPAAGHIKLGFQWYPATRGHAIGTILAVQGGPGFPTTDYAAAYRGTFLPLLGRRNLLLVNLRGTGNSSAFLCRPLQNWKAADGIVAYTVDTGKCGRQLNHSIRRPGGGYVQASDLYTTANAARDVALLLRRLQTGKVDLYGDSYGTFFGQTFTARYAPLLRSVTLDSAYPVSQTNPFYPHMILTARRAFNISCARSVACHLAAPGRSWARVGALARYLRRHPVTGRTRTPFGAKVTEHVGVTELIEMVNDAGSDNGVYRELDAAGRALLRDHDPVPLLRLTEQDVFTGTSGPVRQFNDGLYQATTCLDYPQPFSYSQTPAQRAVSYARAIAALPGGAFAPFTVYEWVTEPAEEFDACLDWPAPAHPDPPIVTPAPYAPRNLPVLVLSGDLDSLTTPFEGRQTARDMGPSARWILVHNDTHVNAMDDPVGCASGLVQAFVRDPARLRQLNASCAARTPEVRVVGTFPRTLSRVTPATARPGNLAGLTGRRLAAVGAAAVGDAVWRWYYGDGVRGWGLRGGTFRFRGSGGASPIRIRLARVRWTSDTRVSGTVRWDQVSGRIRARLTVAGPGGIFAAVSVRYHDYLTHSTATLSGSYRGRRIAATMPAP
jgi:pimeloyl-ACP methyl ester carboxylesterase